uniref:FAD dependent oxidoreductase domain-containing protein n=1 Tax=Hemiselmis tepida TaxID=464990 RepID=A0A7S0W0Y2_9CRYP
MTHVQMQHHSVWMSEEDPLDTMRTTQELPAECDVVVIGAGVSGCAAALQCQELGLDCVLLDARGVAGGASGTNGGHMWPSNDPSQGRKAFESACAAEMAALLEEAPGPDGSASIDARGGLELALDDEQFAMLKGEEGLEAWSSEKVCEALSAEPGAFAGGIYHPKACGVWPARATRALARKAIAAGANLQTSTTVRGIEEGTGGGVEVQTDRGTVRPRRGVIVCANGWAPKLLPELKGVITPARDHVIVTEPLPRGVWRHSFVAPEAKGSEAGDDFWYGLQLEDGRLCLGGGRRQADGGYAFGEDDDSACDATVVKGVEAFLRGHFVGLEEVGIEMSWPGVLGFSKDGQPLVGKIPGRAKVWVCAGFGGHGMPACLACGRAAARLVHLGVEASTEPYLEGLSPARFWAGEGAGGEGKPAVCAEKAGGLTKSLGGKGPDAIPSVGETPASALPGANQPPPEDYDYMREMSKTKEGRKQLAKDLEALFGGRGARTRPRSESDENPLPLPSFAPATIEDDSDRPANAPQGGGGGLSSLGALPDVHQPPPIGHRGDRASSSDASKQFAMEIDTLFGSLGVQRGAALEDVLKPTLAVPLPSFSPAVVGEDLIDPIVTPHATEN